MSENVLSQLTQFLQSPKRCLLVPIKQIKLHLAAAARQCSNLNLFEADRTNWLKIKSTRSLHCNGKPGFN